jgi:hypothetical protein
MGVKFLADHATVVETASGAEAVRQFNSAAVRASGAAAKDGFPVGTTSSLTGMTLTLLGNWHGEIPLFCRIFNKIT